MSAWRQSLCCSRTFAGQVLFVLMGLAFLLRSLVPLGYMPSMVERGGFPFAITLCSVGGINVATVAGTDSGGHSSQDHFSETCPYGLALAYKLLPGSNGAQLAYGLGSLTVAVGLLAQPVRSLLVSGPPLGSRAPPADILHAFIT